MVVSVLAVSLDPIGVVFGAWPPGMLLVAVAPPSGGAVVSVDSVPLVEVERTTWPSGSNFCSCVVERLWSMSAVTWTRAAPAPTLADLGIF